MAWILDEYSKFHGHSPAVVTGKPIVSVQNNWELKALVPFRSMCTEGIDFSIELIKSMGF